MYLLQKLQCLFSFHSSVFLRNTFQNVSGILDGHTQYLPLGSPHLNMLPHMDEMAWWKKSSAYK